MVSVPSPFGGNDDDVFEARDEFVPGSIPKPGPFLDRHEVLTGRRHLAFHRLSRELFEERAVYDMTFGYNLARLNEDTRHPGAGYRYAVEDPENTEEGIERPSDDARVLRAEFTPTTAFCPQSDTLTKGSLRAWNGLADRHEYDLVRVRVAPMHQRAATINDQLHELERAVVETGSLPDAAGAGASGRSGEASHQDRARAGVLDDTGAGDSGTGDSRADDSRADDLGTNGRGGPSAPF